MKAIITFTSGLESSTSGKSTAIKVQLGTPGDTGAQGVQGEQGIQGVQGPKGDKGDLGAAAAVVQAVSSSTTDVPSCKAVTDAKELLFRDMWNSACGADGTYNAATGYYELNGITDLTYSQAVDIMNYGFISWLPNGASTGNQPLANRIRTMFPPQNNRIFAGGTPLSMQGNFQNMFGIEVVKFQAGTESTIIVSNGGYMFYMCEKLKQIIGIFNLGNAPAITGSFYLCSALVSIKLLNLKTNINLKYSPLLSYDSVKYMVDNAANTTAIVITVHATTLSYLNGTASSYTSTGHTKEEWRAIVTSATTKNITFAS